MDARTPPSPLVRRLDRTAISLDRKECHVSRFPYLRCHSARTLSRPLPGHPPSVSFSVSRWVDGHPPLPLPPSPSLPLATLSPSFPWPPSSPPGFPLFLFFISGYLPGYPPPPPPHLPLPCPCSVNLASAFPSLLAPPPLPTHHLSTTRVN